MTIDQAIQRLEAEKAAGVKSVILAWWDASVFGRIDDADWRHDAEFIERRMDWSRTQDDLQAALEGIQTDE